ncbi:amino acid ABC transporter permease [Phyllobacterium chamaecytisi]|uniref:amino acid ABC transporter permease n=1 Tax=Phyllobacterium chamaecytisi TaxID=2876082 RepID=UPI001CCAB83F|nr:amino acid ABC transporter permease [Phyllobacterium sp. KW56]MBZ9603286.1 amino acid ABC transporter permease [Phyllobacterium sp. KW56]
MNLDWSIVWEYRWAFLFGVMNTVLLAVVTMLVAIPGGIVIMLMRNSPVRALRGIATVYVETFRATPLILLVYWIFYVMPRFGVHLPPFLTGVVALSLIVSAYNSETFRAGVNSIRKGQSDAGLALGMSKWQLQVKVILPQALRRVLPAFSNTWVSLFKDTSLVSVIAVSELSYVSLQARAESFRIFEILTAMAAIYWCLGYPQAKLVDWLNRKYEVKE